MPNEPLGKVVERAWSSLPPDVRGGLGVPGSLRYTSRIRDALLRPMALEDFGVDIGRYKSRELVDERRAAEVVAAIVGLEKRLRMVVVWRRPLDGPATAGLRGDAKADLIDKINRFLRRKNPSRPPTDEEIEEMKRRFIPTDDARPPSIFTLNKLLADPKAVARLEGRVQRVGAETVGTDPEDPEDAYEREAAFADFMSQSRGESAQRAWDRLVKSDPWKSLVARPNAVGLARKRTPAPLRLTEAEDDESVGAKGATLFPLDRPVVKRAHPYLKEGGAYSVPSMEHYRDTTAEQFLEEQIDQAAMPLGLPDNVLRTCLYVGIQASPVLAQPHHKGQRYSEVARLVTHSKVLVEAYRRNPKLFGHLMASLEDSVAEATTRIWPPIYAVGLARKTFSAETAWRMIMRIYQSLLMDLLEPARRRSVEEPEDPNLAAPEHSDLPSWSRTVTDLFEEAREHGGDLARRVDLLLAAITRHEPDGPVLWAELVAWHRGLARGPGAQDDYPAYDDLAEWIHDHLRPDNEE